ncbi:serine/threonine protein kinase [Actinoplanes sp. TRM 88003]|uniref:Serine/threonine protein kinase n=1 Tax=Paractinoplanes aksuensis TaxID=2939490 RepID=A0ABT1DLY1_9ACTN|nr:serine/threonine-protein kinase [Actinoplanes aksuensis]MCO8271800.1 serine/threonine protein kinase [Actinoplanes aksuensis]
MAMEMAGEYTLVRKLGSGGMGDVFLGVSPTADQVAVKRIHGHLLDDISMKQRFASEVESLKTVFGSRVARLEDADPYAEPPWLAVEYVDGLTLKQYVEQHGTLPLASTAMIGAMLAEGLDKVHQAGLLHRDLKPQNLILGQQGPVLIDFGLATLTEREDGDGHTQTGMVVGTPAYMAPEQARGEKDLTRAVDVYALGATLVYALTGHTLYSPSQGMLLYQVGNPDVMPDLTGVPPEISSLAKAMLADDVQSRPLLSDVRERLLQIATADGRPVATIRAEVALATFHRSQLEIPEELTDPVRETEDPIEETQPPPAVVGPAVTPPEEPPSTPVEVDVTWLIEKLRRQYARRSTW